jgi:uncharacterized membrane protein YecN with MAPEG domain
MIMDSTIAKNKKRPVWVWAISLFFFVSSVYTLLSFYLIYSGRIPLQSAQKAYLNSLTFIDIGLSVLLLLTNLTAAVLLFLLRKQTFYLFAIALVANLLMTIWHTISNNFMANMSSGRLIGMVIGWIILLVICVYTKHLEKAGVLK